MAITDLHDEVYDAIKTFVTANWSDTPVAWPNEPFTNPEGLPFVAVELHGTLYGQMSIGADVQADNRWDEEGTLWFHVNVRRGAGYSNARGAAKSLANLFRGLTLLSGGLEFMDAVVGPGASADEQGTMFVTSVSIEWRLMEA